VLNSRSPVLFRYLMDIRCFSQLSLLWTPLPQSCVSYSTHITLSSDYIKINIFTSSGWMLAYHCIRTRYNRYSRDGLGEDVGIYHPSPHSSQPQDQGRGGGHLCDVPVSLAGFLFFYEIFHSYGECRIIFIIRLAFGPGAGCSSVGIINLKNYNYGDAAFKDKIGLYLPPWVF
jgi:hypothetical protein